jgi:Transglycosylase SLT domain
VPSKGVDGVGLSALAMGSILVFAGIKGYSVLAVAQNVVTGKPLTTGISVEVPLTVQTDTSGVYTPGGPSGGGDNRALGQQIATGYGWGSGAEWDALLALWEKESNWNNHADNPSSHAYGIPQALPYTKMQKAGWPESAGGQSDPQVQIRWGLDYIKGRYGRPSVAWSHEKVNNWY